MFKKLFETIIYNCLFQGKIEEQDKKKIISYFNAINWSKFDAISGYATRQRVSCVVKNFQNIK